MNYSLSNMLGRSSVGAAPVISGTAFPGETLTSTNARQWYADGNFISGQTGSTYVVRLSDIGKVITQTGSNALTIWHPDDIAGVVSFWSSLSNVLTSVSPDVAAANGDSVRRWNGILTGNQANQTDGTSQPLYRSTGQSGNPSLEFDGANDSFVLPAASNVLQNKSQGYLIAGVRDTSPTDGDPNHAVISYSRNGNTNNRLGLYTRINSSNSFNAIARRNDLDVATLAVATSNSDYNVLTAHGDWSNGFVRLRVNGTVVSSVALAGGSGNTQNTTSDVAYIGNDGGGTARISGHITCICVVNAPVTATELSQIERYIGLFGSLNIPLV
jgi:hypothetical protein